MIARLTHLDVVQGSSEERMSHMYDTVSERESVADAAMRQEQLQNFWFCQKAGSCNG